MKKQTQTIYEYFNQYSVEDVNKMIALLSKKDRQLLKLKFGDDFTTVNYKSQLTQTQNAYYNTYLLPKMKKLLIGDYKTKREYWHQDMSIYEYFDNYTRKEIDCVLSKLKETDKHLLELRCGKDLDNPVVSNKMTKNEKIRFSRFLIPKLKRLLENSDKNIKERITKNSVVTIYEYFSNYSKETIDLVLETLSNNEKEILSLRFVLDKRNSSYNTLSYEQYQQWYCLTKKVEKLLIDSNLFINSSSGRICKKIYAYFPDYTKEEVDAVIEKLPLKDQDVINLRHKYSLHESEVVWTEEDSIKFYKGIIPKMRGKLAKARRIPVCKKKFKDIYVHYPDFSKEDVDKCLGLLSIEERQLLSLKYCNILDLPVDTSVLTEIDKKRIKYIVDVKLKKGLEFINDPNKKDISFRRTLISVYEHFKGYKKEQIDEVIDSLSDEEKQLLKLKYGDDLENPVKNVTMNSDEKNKFNYLLHVTMTRKLHYLSQVRSHIDVFENTAINRANANQLRILMDMIYSSEYRNLLDKYSTKTVMVMFLYNVGLNNAKFSLKMIADFLNLNIYEVKRIIEACLIDMKQDALNQENTNESFQLVKKV